MKNLVFLLAALLFLLGETSAEITFYQEYPTLEMDLLYTSTELPGGGYACIGAIDYMDARLIRTDELGSLLSDNFYEWNLCGRDICLNADGTSLIHIGATNLYNGYLHVQTDFNGDSEEILSTWLGPLYVPWFMDSASFLLTDDGGTVLTDHDENSSEALIFKMDAQWELEWLYIPFKLNMTEPTSICSIPGEGYLCSGRVYYSTPDETYGYLVLVDYDGNELWTYQHSEPCGFRDVLPCEDGYVVTVYDLENGCSVICLTPQGEILWEYINSELSWINSICQVGNCDYIFIGIYKFLNPDYYRIVLTRLDVDGNFVWERAYGDSSWSLHASDIIQTEDDGFLITGSRLYYESQSYTGNSMLLKVDSDGLLEPQGTEPEPDVSDVILAVYPNPSTGVITLDYTVPVQMYVDISIFDLSGRIVTTVYQGMTDRGEHTASVKDLPTGIYTARISTAATNSVERFTVLH